MRSLGLPKSLMLLLTATAFAMPIRADEADSRPTAEPANAALPSTSSDAGEAVRDAVQRLGAERFLDREVASSELFQAGEKAITLLEQAAQSENAEVRGRAVDVLKRHVDGSAAATQDAAKKALERLAENNRPQVANLAKAVLQPKPRANDIAMMPGIMMPAIQIMPGQAFPIQAQIQVRAAAVGGRRVQIRQANGVKDIEAEEGDRKVKIHEDAQGIKMEVTQKKDGKEVTEKYEAKNADELKKKHPEAGKIYDEFGPKGGVQIQINAVPGLPGIQPGRPPIQPPGAPRPARPAPDEVRKRINETIERLKKQAENSPNADGLKRAIEQLERTRDRIGGEERPPAAPENDAPKNNDAP